MIIKTAEFRCSSSRSSQCPADGLPEFGFIGRSNVGKSSLINMLTDRKALAKVSGTPGKTRLINHFTINGGWYLVDLPGYGYARVSKTERAGFSQLITDYLSNNGQLRYLFILVDSRLEPQKIDVEFLRMIEASGIPHGLAFTKTDKLTDNKVESSVARYRKFLKGAGMRVPDIFITSSEKRRGRDEILSFIEECLPAVEDMNQKPI